MIRVSKESMMEMLKRSKKEFDALPEEEKERRRAAQKANEEWEHFLRIMPICRECEKFESGDCEGTNKYFNEKPDCK